MLIQLQEKLDPFLLIGLLTHRHVVKDDQDTVSNSHSRPFGAPPPTGCATRFITEQEWGKSQGIFELRMFPQ